MSGSSKIAIVFALLLCVGIVSYHMLQPGTEDSPAISIPQQPATASRTQTHLNPPSDSDDSSQPGVGDLMSRIRSHIESTSSSPDQVAASEDRADQTALAATSTTAPDVATSDVNTAGLSDASADDRPTSPRADPGSGSGVVLAGDTPPTPSTTAATDPAGRRSDDVPRTYQVQPGDTLATIAIKFYGSPQHWIDIATANPFADPRRLQVGQTLRLPDPDDMLDIANFPVQQPSSRAVTHTIRPGESLYSIAKRYYKNANRWRVIFDANRDVLGSDPDDLQPGTKLVIPPAP